MTAAVLLHRIQAMRATANAPAEVVSNQAPVAKITPALTVDVGVTIDIISGINPANGTYDPDGDPFDQAHTLISKPEGSTAELVTVSSSPDTMHSRLTGDLPGEYVVRNTVTDDPTGRGADPSQALTSTIERTYTFVGVAEPPPPPPPANTAAGDANAPGAPDLTNWPNVDLVLTASPTGSTFVRNVPGVGNTTFERGWENWPITQYSGGLATSKSPGETGGMRPLIVPASGGKVRIVSRNPGGRVDKGHEWRIARQEYGLVGVRRWAVEFGMMFPANFEVLGDMKMPGLAGTRGGNDLSALRNTYFHHLGTGDAPTYKHFTCAFMTQPRGSGSTTTRPIGMTSYIIAKNAGDVVNWDNPNLSNDHFLYRVRTAQGASTDLEMVRGVWYAVGIEMWLNDPGQKNGGYRLYVTPPGSQQRVKRQEVTSIEWTDAADALINMFNFRSFWGGNVATQAPVNATDANSAPNFQTFLFGPTLADIPRQVYV